MWWIIALIIVAAAFAFPKFRIALLIVVSIVGVALWVYISNVNREAEAAKGRIGTQEVDLVDLRLEPAYGNGSYQLLGRVRNRSPRFTLTGIQIQVTMKDCARVLSSAELKQIMDLERNSTHLTYEQREALGGLRRRREEQATPNWSPGCETVGETLQHLSVSVPSGQSRDLDDYVHFSHLGAAKGEHTWRYTISEITGK